MICASRRKTELIFTGCHDVKHEMWQQPLADAKVVKVCVCECVSVCVFNMWLSVRVCCDVK